MPTRRTTFKIRKGFGADGSKVDLIHCVNLLFALTASSLTYQYYLSAFLDALFMFGKSFYKSFELVCCICLCSCKLKVKMFYVSRQILLLQFAMH